MSENREENSHSKELEKSISQMHQLIVKLNAQQNDINKMDKITNELKTNADKAKNLHNNSKKEDKSLALVIEMKIIKELEKMQKEIKKWKRTRILHLKGLHEKSIYGCLLKLTFTINLLKWKTENVITEEMDIFMRKELRQLIVKLALLRRFLLSHSRDEMEKLNGNKE